MNQENKLEKILEQYRGEIYIDRKKALAQALASIAEIVEAAKIKDAKDKPTRLPTALCPKCDEYSFRIYKDEISNNKHQCCNCQNIFVPKLPPGSKVEEIEEIIEKYVDCAAELEGQSAAVYTIRIDKKGLAVAIVEYLKGRT